MTQRQRAFADEYIKTGNATRAYKAVYGAQTEHAAETSASRLLRNDEVSEYIAAQGEAIHDLTIASAKEIMAILTSIVRGEDQATISERITAAHLLARMLGADKPRGDRGGNDGVVLVIRR